jgi:hypothetical protein
MPAEAGNRREGFLMGRSRAALPVLLIVASLASNACSSTPTTNGSILGGEFHDKVIAACAHSVALHTAMGTFPLSSFNPGQPGQAALGKIANHLQKDQDRYQTLVTELTALGTPSSGATLWTAVLDAANEHLAIAADQATAAASGDVDSFTKDYAAGTRAQADFLAAINAAGVPECAPVDR